MQGLAIGLTLFTAFGFLPLAIIVYKKRRVDNLLLTGTAAKARVYEITGIRESAAVIVYYTYYGSDSRQYTGTLTCKAGLYNINDVIDVYFDPRNPKKSTMKGAWESPVFLIFGIAIAVFVVFAAYKIYTGIQSGEL